MFVGQPTWSKDILNWPRLLDTTQKLKTTKPNWLWIRKPIFSITFKMTWRMELSWIQKYPCQKYYFWLHLGDGAARLGTALLGAALLPKYKNKIERSQRLLCRSLILLWAIYPIGLAFKSTLSGCNLHCYFKRLITITMTCHDSKHTKWGIQFE